MIGLDYLSYPTGAIKQAQDLAAAAFGAEQSWFLVNGTTTGELMKIHVMHVRAAGSSHPERLSTR